MNPKCNHGPTGQCLHCLNDKKDEKIVEKKD